MESCFTVSTTVIETTVSVSVFVCFADSCSDFLFRLHEKIIPTIAIKKKVEILVEDIKNLRGKPKQNNKTRFMFVSLLCKMIKQIFLILMVGAGSVTAQTNIVGSFKGAQLNQTVYLAFTIIAGQTCSGINIERSTDSLNFNKIGDIAGVCGSISSPVDYTYVDSFPIHNAYNYYRLAPGNSDWSQVIKVYFKPKDISEFVVTPNPFITSTTISYKNPLNKSIQWKIFNVSGQQTMEGTTKDDSFILTRINLSSGMYFLHLTIDNNDFQKAKLNIE